MAKLSNIVGGLMRDLAQSHAISDAYTVETLESYRRDPLLAQFPVPRMAIREVQLKIRFAVASVQDPPTEPDPTEIRNLWLKAVQERILPQALTAVGRADNKTVVTAFKRRLAAPEAALAVDAADVLASDRREALTNATLSFLKEQVAALPASARRSVDRTDLLPELERVVARELPEIQRAARQLEAARVAAQSDLDVVVTSEALGSVSDSRISELNVTVAMDDVQFGGVPEDVQEVG
jgi:hypothetical protein